MLYVITERTNGKRTLQVEIEIFDEAATITCGSMQELWEQEMISIAKLELPDFGAPSTIPEIPAKCYAERQRKLRLRMDEAELNCLLVYADREHSANMSYLTGFDPRFEEALFVMAPDNRNTLIVGNECRGVVGDLRIECDILLCQEFSLMGQDRSQSWDLRPLLNEAGIRTGTHCGAVGWKSLMEGRLELPAWIVQLIKEESGIPAVNANDLLMHPQTGLRIRNEPEQIAFFEYAATRTSESVLALLRDLEPGRRAFELARVYDGGGLPNSCHPMVSFGSSIPNGMASPSNAKLNEGDSLTCALGIWGSLTCRAGLVVRDPLAFKSGKGADVWAVIENYLHVVKSWYASIHVGARAAEVWAAADTARDPDLYSFCVNTGHYIHLDEWVCSPFEKGSEATLPSNAAIQADIIPVPTVQGINVNMEDGFILADETLRGTLQEQYPDMYQRCITRRNFMTGTLGYELSDDILPLGNTPGVYFPCLLDTQNVCRFKRD